MNKGPLISVIIPVYNGEETISQTIRSVLYQTFTDFELIIINDGSTDGTVDIIKKINDHRIKLFNYENQGLYISRTRGIKKAIGCYISFIDADDLWAPEKLEFQYNALIDNPDYDVVYSWTVFIDEVGKYIFPMKKSYYEGRIYEELIKRNFIGSGSNILVKKDSLLLSINGQPETETDFCADWELYIYLSKRSKFKLVPRFDVFYRHFYVSMSSNIELNEIQSINLINRISKGNSNTAILVKIALSNIKMYSCFLYLTIGNTKHNNKNAWIKYYESFKIYPRKLIDIDFLFLGTILLFISFIPFSIDSKKIFRLYGQMYSLFSNKV